MYNLMILANLYTSHYHPNQDLKYSSTPEHSLICLCSQFLTPSWPQETNDLLSFSVDMFLFLFHINGIIQYALCFIKIHSPCGIYLYFVPFYCE